MAQLFSYWHCEPGRGINCMRAIFLSLVLVSSFVDSQAQAAPDKIKTDVRTIQTAVNDAVGTSLPGWGVLQSAKAAYLEGYGVVVTMEIAFDSPANPFTGNKSPEEVRATAAQKRKEVQEKLMNVLKQKTAALESIAPTESVAIILNVLNTNPAYVPNMPSQIIFSVKKQDAAHPSIKEY
jgi:hypothetical protein